MSATPATPATPAMPAMPSIPASFAFSDRSVELPGKNDGVTVESAEDKISFSGNFDITKDVRGLELARALSIILQQSIDLLVKEQAAGNLPQVLKLQKPTERPNPFGNDA